MSSYFDKQSATLKCTASRDSAAPTDTARHKRDIQTFAKEYLKAKGISQSMTEIIDHLGLCNESDKHKQELAESLRGHPRIEWKPDLSLSEQTWKTGMYSYRPIVPGVTDGTSLIAFLQRKTDASSLAVRDLKDGWADCEDTLAKLEGQHKILVARTNRENLPRHVWLNDASLHHNIQPEFQAMWHRVQIPSIDDMHYKLSSVQIKPTSEDPRTLLAPDSHTFPTWLS